ncbi:MAG: guanitoxin biosynthesis pre-guanitoxin forming N-methyltransferase GntF [Chloroflexota bacterium]
MSLTYYLSSAHQNNKLIVKSFTKGAYLMNRSNIFNRWDAQQYLTDYYNNISQDELATLSFLCHEAKKIKNQPIALEFGSGPTIHHVLPIAPYVSELHMADYLSSNLNEIRKWKTKQREAHDWYKFTDYILSNDATYVAHDQDQIAQREDLTRQKITHFYELGLGKKNKYDVVISCYCADSATESRSDWYRYMSNIIGLLKKSGGFLLIAALRNCHSYRVGNNYFPSANINENDINILFSKNHIAKHSSTIKIAYVPETKSYGYDSIVLASGFVS